MKKFMLAAMVAAFAISTVAPAVFVDKAFAQDKDKKKDGEKKKDKK